MCSGRVSPHFIMKAFQKGADGVLIAACHLGECHYSKGNYLTAKRVAVLKEMLAFMGIGGERLKLEYIATSESGKLCAGLHELHGARAGSRTVPPEERGCPWIN